MIPIYLRITVTIRIPEYSGIWMVDLCPVVNGSGIQMVVWKLDWKRPVCGPKCQVFEWSAKWRDLTIWILDTHTVWYSDESGIHVFGIQMVTIIHDNAKGFILELIQNVWFSIRLDNLIARHKTNWTKINKIQICPDFRSPLYNVCCLVWCTTCWWYEDLWWPRKCCLWRAGCKIKYLRACSVSTFWGHL